MNQTTQKLIEAISKANPSLLEKEKDMFMLKPSIYLEHLLKTINNMLVVVDCMGNVYKLEMKMSYKHPKFTEPVCKLDLTKSPLNQTQEVQEALLELIG